MVESSTFCPAGLGSILRITVFYFEEFVARTDDWREHGGLIVPISFASADGGLVLQKANRKMLLVFFKMVLSRPLFHPFSSFQSTKLKNVKLSAGIELGSSE